MINYAVVGYGGMAEFHVKRLSGIDGYNVAGIYDINPMRNAIAAERGLQVYSSYEEIAKDNSVNAVLIATPNDLHVTYTEYFAAAKKHILCEKPAALSSGEYARMVNAAHDNGVVLCVHQNRRWDKDFLTVCEILKSGLLGNVSRIESNVCGANGIPGGWRKELKHGGGMMLDWGVHLIDQACCMLDDAIEFLYCDYSYDTGCEAEDAFHIDLKFNCGTLFRIVVETNTFVPVPRWVVKGEYGTAIIENWSLDGKIVFKRHSDEEIAGEKAGNGFTKTMAARPVSAIETVPLMNVKVDENTFYKNFFDACINKKEQIVKHGQVMRVMELMEKAKLSAEKNEVIKGSF